MSEHVLDPPRLANAQAFPAPAALNRQLVEPALLANQSNVIRSTLTENRRRSATGIAPSSGGVPPSSVAPSHQGESMARIKNTLIGPYRL